MKLNIIKQAWTQEELEAGDSNGEIYSEIVNCNSIESIIDVFSEYNDMQPSSFPPICEDNFWMFGYLETDYKTGNETSVSVHVVNPTEYNKRLFFKAYSTMKGQ